MTNKYIHNERFFAQFKNTALDTYEKFKNVFDLPAQEIDEQTKDWLISIASCIKFDTYNALSICLAPKKENTISTIPDSKRFLPETKEITQKSTHTELELRHIRMLFHPAKIDSLTIDPRYIAQCFFFTGRVRSTGRIHRY